MPVAASARVVVTREVNTRPASPAMKPLSVYAISLARLTLRPEKRAAVSLLPIA
jgi:hypothetical protein